MKVSAMGKAVISLIVWMIIALGLGFFNQDGITRTFGPDTWWLVMGWAGLVLGLMNFLWVLIMARKPADA